MGRTRRRYTKGRPQDPDALDAPWRVFVACALPPKLSDAVDRLVGQLAATDLPIRWVSGSSAHLTLQFVGEVPPETVEILRLGLPRGLSGMPSVRLQVDGAGAFPSIDRPNVVWLGLGGDLDGLGRLRRKVAGTLASLAFELDPEPFKPHITLGRTRRPLSGDELATLRRLLRPERLHAELPKALLSPFDVTEVELVRSVLTSEGARYTAVQTIPLAKAEAG